MLSIKEEQSTLFNNGSVAQHKIMRQNKYKINMKRDFVFCAFNIKSIPVSDYKIKYPKLYVTGWYKSLYRCVYICYCYCLLVFGGWIRA